MNKYNSIFGQILSLFPRIQFEAFVKETRSAKRIKGFNCWDQFVAMIFCQLEQAQTLREICGGLATSLGKMIHLGIKKAPSRSTLAYANEHRPWQLYQKLFFHILGLCHSQFGGKHKFRFKNRLLSFDATQISLCLSLFDWAKYRRAKGAIKLHLLLDHAGYLPQFLDLTAAKTHEVQILKKLALDPGTIIVFDRGLIDYATWAKWIKEGVFFVTRLKTNAAYRIVHRNPVVERSHVLKDQLIHLTGFYSKRKCPYALRMVVYRDPESGEKFEFITNNMSLAASTIAAIYKDRWQIETFFKALKQNFRVKTFVGTSFNAVMIQIWTALISILILKYLKAKSRISWSLANLVAMLRMNLLTYNDLWDWLNHPYFSPPVQIEPVQECLAL